MIVLSTKVLVDVKIKRIEKVNRPSNKDEFDMTTNEFAVVSMLES